MSAPLKLTSDFTLTLKRQTLFVHVIIQGDDSDFQDCDSGNIIISSVWKNYLRHVQITKTTNKMKTMDEES